MHFLLRVLFGFSLHSATCGMLLPRPGTEPGPSSKQQALTAEQTENFHQVCFLCESLSLSLSRSDCLVCFICLSVSSSLS